MDRKLQQQIIDKCPLLYADKNRPITESLMAFGIEVGDGWYDLILECSLKLEQEIQKFIEENLLSGCECGHDWLQHDNPRTNVKLKIDNHCNYSFKYKETPFRKLLMWAHSPTWLKGWKGKLKAKVKHVLCKILTKTFFVPKTFRCDCKNYVQYHPRAAQIKEKYGTLRLYMTHSTDKMEEIIREAERKSAMTCEQCGKAGEERGGGWILTLCDSCEDDRNKRWSKENK